MWTQFHPIILGDQKSHSHNTFSDNLSFFFSTGRWTLLLTLVSLLWGLAHYDSEWVAILSWPHHKKENGTSALQINKSSGFPWVQGKIWKMNCMAFLHCIQQRGIDTHMKGVSDRAGNNLFVLWSALNCSLRGVLPILAPKQKCIGMPILIPIFKYA